VFQGYHQRLERHGPEEAHLRREQCLWTTRQQTGKVITSRTPTSKTSMECELSDPVRLLSRLLIPAHLLTSSMCELSDFQHLAVVISGFMLLVLYVYPKLRWQPRTRYATPKLSGIYLGNTVYHTSQVIRI
jgi:hypothetical protein